MGDTEKNIEITISEMKRSIFEVEKVLTKMELSLERIEDGLKANQIDFALFKEWRADIIALKLPFVVEKVNAMLEGQIFRAMEGGLSFKKFAVWGLGLIGTAIGIGLLNLLIKR